MANQTSMLARLNDSNGSEPEVSDIVPEDDVIVVTIWTVMLVYALVANILVQIGIFRSPAMRQATSYWFIISLSICDIVMILISLFHLIPATSMHDEFVTLLDPRNIWAIFLYDVFWYTGVLKLGLMAVNRFASIVYPMDYNRLFSKERTAMIIGGLYTVGLCVSVPTLFPCCHTVYDHRWYITVYHPPDTPYFVVDILVNTVSVIMMVICYAVILNKVRQSQKAVNKHKSAHPNSSSRQKSENADDQDSPKRSLASQRGATISRREMRLFLQFFVVSLVFLLTWSTWQWLGRIGTSKWVYFLLTSFFFINNAINPTVYLIFNSGLRREVRTFLCRCTTNDNRTPGAQRTKSTRFAYLSSRKNNNNNHNNNNNNNEPTSSMHQDSSSSTHSGYKRSRRSGKRALLRGEENGRPNFLSAAWRRLSQSVGLGSPVDLPSNLKTSQCASDAEEEAQQEPLVLQNHCAVECERSERPPAPPYLTQCAQNTDGNLQGDGQLREEEEKLVLLSPLIEEEEEAAEKVGEAKKSDSADSESVLFNHFIPQIKGEVICYTSTV